MAICKFRIWKSFYMNNTTKLDDIFQYSLYNPNNKQI